MRAERPSELARLPARYGPLFDRALARCAADDRVRAVWLHGACARRDADAGSDLDLSIAVRDADGDEFAAGWRDWLAGITPTVLARPIGAGGGFYALTPTCERFDVVIERVSGLPTTWLRRRVVVLDKDGLAALVPPPEDPGPDPEAVAFLVEEVLRQQANFPAVLIRADWLLGVVAVQQIHQYLYELLVEDNKPAPEMGAKRWSDKLTPAQVTLLSGLPVPSAEPGSVRRARLAALSAFLRAARDITARRGVPWPGALETAVRGYLAGYDLAIPG